MPRPTIIAVGSLVRWQQAAGSLTRDHTEEAHYNPSYSHHPRSSGIKAIAKEAGSGEGENSLGLTDWSFVDSRSYARYYTLRIEVTWSAWRRPYKAFIRVKDIILD